MPVVLALPRLGPLRNENVAAQIDEAVLTREGDGVSEVLVLSRLQLISCGYNLDIEWDIDSVPRVLWLDHKGAPIAKPRIVLDAGLPTGFDVYPAPVADLGSHLYSYLPFVPLHLVHRDLIDILVTESPQIPFGSDPVQECHWQLHSLIFPNGFHQ